MPCGSRRAVACLKGWRVDEDPDDRGLLIKETHLQLLRYLEAHPQVSQRELSEHLGVSLGKTNYCLRSLVDTGLVKARNFKNNRNKRAYLYVLTPKGLDAKARITARFLQRKMDEYERLKGEIDMLKAELEARQDNQRPGKES